MSIFDKFDSNIDTNALEKARADAAENTFEEVPSGRYTAKIESMELGMTRDKRPMFKAQFRLIDGLDEKEKEILSKYKKKKPCVFMNRVIFGTKNDYNMIASVEGWLNKIGFAEPVVFTTYSDFADVISDCAEAVDGKMEFDITYNPDKFNAITIDEVYDC